MKITFLISFAGRGSSEVGSLQERGVESNKNFKFGMKKNQR